MFMRFKNLVCVIGVLVGLGLIFSFSVEATQHKLGNPAFCKRDKFYGVDFVDLKNGWVIGNEGTILHTSNGGKVWERQESTTKTELFDVAFSDKNNGWVVGRRGLILNTRDGGKTWRSQKTGTYHNLFDVHFINSRNGWAIGEWATILHTTDGGKKWKVLSTGQDMTNKNLYSSVKMPEEFHSMGGDVILNSIYFADPNHGWTVGEFGIIWHTSDGGKTWVSQQSPGGEKTLYKVYFTEPNRGWIVGIDGIILYTNDGGKDWKFLPSGAVRSLFDIKVIEDKGWAVGVNGEYVTSEDGGMTWFPPKVRPIPSFFWFYRLCFVDRSNGWLVGGHGGVFNTKDGGSSWEGHGAIRF